MSNKENNEKKAADCYYEAGIAAAIGVIFVMVISPIIGILSGLGIM